MGTARGVWTGGLARRSWRSRSRGRRGWDDSDQPARGRSRGRDRRLGRPRRREGQAGRPSEREQGAQRDLGRHAHQAGRRAQRDRRLSGDCRSRRDGHRAAVRGPAVADACSGAQQRRDADGGRRDVIAYKAPAADPTDYRDRPIQIFSQHYLSVTEATRATWVFHPDTPAAPKNPLGWTPVQLVPENATAGRGGFPVRVAANQNQGLWFDIYIGRDRAPGTYRGEVTVTADQTTRRIPVDDRGAGCHAAR